MIRIYFKDGAYIDYDLTDMVTLAIGKLPEIDIIRYIPVGGDPKYLD